MDTQVDANTRRSFQDLGVTCVSNKYITDINGHRERSISPKASHLLWVLMESPGSVFTYEVLRFRLNIPPLVKEGRHQLRQYVSIIHTLCELVELDVRIGLVNDVGLVLCAIKKEGQSIANS